MRVFTHVDKLCHRRKSSFVSSHCDQKSKPHKKSRKKKEKKIKGKDECQTLIFYHSNISCLC